MNDLSKLSLVIISSRFRVIFEMIKPDKLDGSTTLKGLQYIDVPGQMKKDYKIDFYAHKEGTVSAKVCWTVNYCMNVFKHQMREVSRLVIKMRSYFSNVHKSCTNATIFQLICCS